MKLETTVAYVGLEFKPTEELEFPIPDKKTQEKIVRFLE